MDIADVTRRIAEAVAAQPGLGKTLKFDFGASGKVYIDGAASPAAVSNEDRPADCTVRLDWNDFVAMTEGKGDATMSAVMGRLQLEGDPAVALKLQPIFAKLR